MILENDLFCVVRGFPMANGCHSRDHEGKVYRALSVCDSLIVGDLLHGHDAWSKQRVQFNLHEVEVQRVPQSHLDALQSVPQSETAVTA